MDYKPFIRFGWYKSYTENVKVSVKHLHEESLIFLK